MFDPQEEGPESRALFFLLFGFSFLVTVAFVPGIVDPATLPRWSIIAAGAPLLLMLRTERFPNPLEGAGLAVVISLAAGIAWSPDVLTGYEELAHLAILAVVFCLGASLADLRPLWQGLCVGVAVNAFIAFLQVLGWYELPQAAAPAGLFMNRNPLAEVALVALIVGGARFWYAVGPCIALVLTHSRAALGALLVVWSISLWPRHRTAAVAILLVAGAAAVGAFTLGSESALIRLGVWKSALSNLAVLGNGVGSFVTAYPQAQYAHSEPIQLVYEHGVLALPFFIMLWLLWRVPGYETEHLVLAAICAVGLFAFPLRLPATAFAFALAAGHLARGWALVRRGVDGGRDPDRGAHDRAAGAPDCGAAALR